MGPLAPGSPARLTFNTGVDSRASWLPDGSAFLYTQEQIGRPDQDRCLAVMPRTGGATIRTICATSDPAGDSLNDFESAAVSTTGRLAYVRSSVLAGVGRATPDNGALVLATYAAPEPATVLEPLSYFGPSATPVDLVTDLHWDTPTSLMFVANQVAYPCVNTGCTAVDTVVTGVEIERIDFTGTGPVLSSVPGTSQACALALGGPDTAYYALDSSSQVHRRILSTNADSMVSDFASGFVTGLSVARGRIAATVSGALHLVSLGTGVDQVLLSSGVSHPALDPTGRFLVADVADSATSLVPDLWLWTVP